MLISTNNKPSINEFKALVDNVTLQLNESAKKRSNYFLERNAQLLEDDVLEFLNNNAKGTKFKGTIEKISGQRFPDIIAGKYYGVEVKSSKDEKWITLGGSVNESTRVKDVERIFLTFGKLVDPVEFCSRPYEDCLSDVVVTHYPRYKIDMNLEKGETIFDKMKTTYDELRILDDPVGEIVEYYRNQLKPGESLWWTGKVTKDEQVQSVPIKIRLWKTLSQDEKLYFIVTGLALFPELTSNSTRKYENFTLWLAANHSIINTSTRDSFSAGGKVDIGPFKKLPKIFEHINENFNLIDKIITFSEESVLCETWKVKNINKERLGQWIDLISNNCVLEKHDIIKVMKFIFNRE